MSRKNTVAAARKKETPRQKRYSCIIVKGNSSIYQVGSVLVKIITIATAPRENMKLTAELVTHAIVNMYRGTYIFFNIGAFPITDHIPVLVDSLRKSKSARPMSIYTG